MSLFKGKSQAVTTEDTKNNQWTMETLREYLLAIMATNDARYSERFESSQTALQAALTAQQTAMQTAFTAQKLSVDAALAAADRAVNKAETASEKRFEGVNEFRGTLQDQQRTLMPRAEAEFADKVLAEKMEAMTRQLTEKIESMSKSLTEKIDVHTQTLLTTAGQKSGLKDGWLYLIGAIGILSLAVTVILHFIPVP